MIAAAQTDSQRGAFASWLVQRKGVPAADHGSALDKRSAGRASALRNLCRAGGTSEPDFAPSTRQGSVSIPLVWKSIEKSESSSGCGRRLYRQESAREWELCAVRGPCCCGQSRGPRSRTTVESGRVAPDPSRESSIGMAIGFRAWKSQQPERHQVPEAVNSYKAEMKVGNAWSSNQRRYATAKEADEAGKDLYRRWTSAEDYRVVLSSDPPNVVACHQSASGRNRTK